jgi:hypothetical protein
MKNSRTHLKLIRNRLVSKSQAITNNRFKGDGWGRSEYMSLPENLT